MSTNFCGVLYGVALGALLQHRAEVTIFVCSPVFSPNMLVGGLTEYWHEDQEVSPSTTKLPLLGP